MILSIIIPAYNEEKRILPTLTEYYSFFNKKLKSEFEIIIVPNNCSDKTFKISKNFSFGKSQIYALNVPDKVGKGGAVKEGFKIAKGNFIGFVDADNSTSPKEFFKLFNHIKNNDAIIASRKLSASKVYPKRKFRQELSSNIFSFLVRVLFNFQFKDTQCGAKIFERSSVETILKESNENGWIFDVEFLSILKKHNKKVIEFPVNWNDSEGSKLTLAQGINSIIRLFQYRINSFFLKRPK